MVAKEDAEIIIVQAYLPEPLSDDELKQILTKIISTTGASSMKEMGKVMGVAKQEIGSRADGGRINEIVKGLLG